MFLYLNILLKCNTANNTLKTKRIPRPSCNTLTGFNQLICLQYLPCLKCHKPSNHNYALIFIHTIWKETKPLFIEMNSQQDRADKHKLEEDWTFSLLWKKKVRKEEKIKGITVVCGFAYFVPTAKINVFYCIYMVHVWGCYWRSNLAFTSWNL